MTDFAPNPLWFQFAVHAKEEMKTIYVIHVRMLEIVQRFPRE